MGGVHRLAGGEGLVGLGQPAPCLAGAALARTPARPAGACLSRQCDEPATRLVRPGSSGAEAALEALGRLQGDLGRLAAYCRVILLALLSLIGRGIGAARLSSDRPVARVLASAWSTS